jgi:hypothetical protein
MTSEFTPRKAEKHSVKLKMAIQGPSGSGKTEGALALATNFAPDAKILVIDTENDSASLYADRYNFDTISLTAPYTSERYKKAMQVAAQNSYDVLIVDSLTQQWDGDGGILRRKEEKDRSGGNSFTNWASFTPEHTGFMEFIKQLPVHTICTMRTKQAYVLEKNDRGKETPRKVGLDPIQRDGTEYEYTIVFDVNMAHRATTSKNRTTLFQTDDPIDLASPKVAGEIRDWLANGLPPEFADSIQVQKLWNACAASGKTKEDIKAKFAEAKILHTTQISLDWYEVLMEWATPTPVIANIHGVEATDDDIPF